METRTHPATHPTDCLRVAPMGRRRAAVLTNRGPIEIHPVAIDGDGYDDCGAYWGHGSPLWVAFDDPRESVYFRARDIDEAMAHVHSTLVDDPTRPTIFHLFTDEEAAE